MSKHIVVLPGDGIGSEVTIAALDVLRTIADLFSTKFTFEEHLIGGASLDKTGSPITDDVIFAAKNADAVLLGAVGGPKWDNLKADKRPEQSLLRLRKDLGLYINMRPVKVLPCLAAASTLKQEVVAGVDLLVVRELTGGIYFGEPKFVETYGDEERAVDSMVYTTSEIERIAHAAFKAATIRRGKVTSVDKANILATSQLWRKTVTRIARHYPEVTLEHILVDNCAMQLVRNPLQFDVILTENMFGDILSDEAAMLTGSIGMLPSASFGDSGALYEPVHGSAPDITGQDIANPIASIASAAMMLRYSFDMEEAAKGVETAIEHVLEQGYRCADLPLNSKQIVGTQKMGSLINESLILSIH